MQFDGALIKEQNTTFAIIVVKAHIFNNARACEDARHSLRPIFPGIPIILMAQGFDGNPTYQGRKDIVAFLVTVDPFRIPWKTYNYS